MQIAVSLTTINIIEKPPEGTVWCVDRQRSEVALVESVYTVPFVNQAHDGLHVAESSLHGVGGYVEWIESSHLARAGAPVHLKVLRDDVDGHHERLAHQRGAAAREERLRFRVGDLVLGQQLSYALVGRHVSHLRHDHQVAHPESLVESSPALSLQYLHEGVVRPVVDGVLSLQLETRADQRDGIQQAADDEPTECGQREVLSFVHHVQLDHTNPVGGVGFARLRRHYADGRCTIVGKLCQRRQKHSTLCRIRLHLLRWSGRRVGGGPDAWVVEQRLHGRVLSRLRC